MSLYARGIVQQPTPASASSRTSEVAVDVLSPYVNYLKSVLLPKEPDTELRTVDQMVRRHGKGRVHDIRELPRCVFFSDLTGAS